LQIDVITSLPTRYETFKSDAAEQEIVGNLSVTRIRLPKHRSGMLDQARSFSYFARAVNRHTRGQHYDLVYATSSRLFTAALGSWVARRRRAPLYLDIRDIFVDTMKDILPAPVALPLQPVLSAVERWTINRAQRVNLVSGGFKPYFETRYQRQRFSYFTNGVDDEFVFSNGASSRNGAEPVKILYAGNIGEGQGLHAIIPQLAEQLQDSTHIKVIGDGGRRAQLEEALRARNIKNVTVANPMSRQQLLNEYRAADVLFLHLNDHSAFEKVLPSKIFEYAALGKPVLAGVSGFAADFIRSEVSNAAVFAPRDVAGGLASLKQLQLRDEPRRDFVSKYSRSNIMKAMASEILSHCVLVSG